MKRTVGLVSVGLAAALVGFPLNTAAQQLPDYSYVGIGGGDEVGFTVGVGYIFN